MKVGVIVPSRAPAPWLAETLDAILAQEPPPATVVVVDSSSDPPLVLDPWHAAACRLVRREGPGGPAAARQAGLDALGEDIELVALCDHDDTWLPGKLAAQTALFAARPEVDVCFGGAEVVGPDGAPTGEAMHPVTAAELDPAVWPAVMYEHSPVATSAIVIRRATLRAVGEFEGPDVAAGDLDFDLWLRLARGHWATVDRTVVRYRRHPGGLSARLATLAAFALVTRERHADLVDEPTRRRVRARDLRALARGRIRERRYAEAGAALAEAAGLSPPTARERLLAVVVRIPGLRGALGRRDPYDSARRA